jgi:hypothetical protein
MKTITIIMTIVSSDVLKISNLSAGMILSNLDCAVKVDTTAKDAIVHSVGRNHLLVMTSGRNTVVKMWVGDSTVIHDGLKGNFKTDGILSAKIKKALPRSARTSAVHVGETYR